MRPNSIITFERLFFISIALGLVGYFLNYDAAMAQLNADPNMSAMGMGGGFLTGAYIVGLAINLLLWYFVARRGSNIARWIFIILTGLGLLFSAPGLAAMGMSLVMVTTLIGIILSVAMLVMLFRADAVAWFSGQGSTDPTTFD